ncbi:MAG: hypothetical protein ACFFBD_26680 [Candidatus Hodarchaeota archaeon]
MIGFFISRLILHFRGNQRPLLSFRGLFSILIVALKVIFDLLVLSPTPLRELVGMQIPPFNGVQNPSILPFLLCSTLIVFVSVVVLENLMGLEPHERYTDALLLATALPAITLMPFPNVDMWVVGLNLCVVEVLVVQLFARLFYYVQLQDFDSDLIGRIPILKIIIGVPMGIMFFVSLSLFLVWFGLLSVLIVGFSLTFLLILSIVQNPIINPKQV